MTHRPRRHHSRRRRLYRDKSRGWIGGVCAGISNHLGVPVFWVRLLTVLPLLSPLAPIVFLCYVVATLRIPLEPESLYQNQEEEEFYRSIQSAPSATFGELRHTMRELEHRLRRLEAYVTSPEFDFEQGMRDEARIRPVR
ncbi:MAG: envelope stress response membrane protein PspC [Xanthomonadales bacterium]|nr:envelope stress response membrane protein PspC [Xanthomonadales bacterium]